MRKVICACVLCHNWSILGLAPEIVANDEKENNSHISRVALLVDMVLFLVFPERGRPFQPHPQVQLEGRKFGSLMWFCKFERL